MAERSKGTLYYANKNHGAVHGVEPVGRRGMTYDVHGGSVNVLIDPLKGGGRLYNVVGRTTDNTVAYSHKFTAHTWLGRPFGALVARAMRTVASERVAQISKGRASVPARRSQRVATA